MIATTQDLMVYTEADFNRLPADGVFEVVDGRAILLPGNDPLHQDISGALFLAFQRQLKSLGYGYVVQAVNVFVPPRPGAVGELQNRVPDLVVSTRRPRDRFRAHEPPELVIEILATPRGNVERTEKMDDYARARIREYWIVDPFAREIEVYLLENGDYARQAATAPLRPLAFPEIALDPQEIWAVLR